MKQQGITKPRHSDVSEPYTTNSNQRIHSSHGKFSINGIDYDVNTYFLLLRNMITLRLGSVSLVHPILSPSLGSCTNRFEFLMFDKEYFSKTLSNMQN